MTRYLYLQFCLIALLLSACAVQPGSLPETTSTETIPVIPATPEDTSTFTPTITNTPSPTATITPEPTPPVLAIEPDDLTQIVVKSELSIPDATAMEWLPDERHIVVATTSLVEIVNIPDGKIIKSFPAQNPRNLTVSDLLSSIAWSDDANYVHVVNGSDLRESIIKADSGNPIISMVFANLDDKLAISSNDNEVGIWGTITQTLVTKWKAPAWIADLAFSSDDQSLGGTDQDDFRKYIFNSQSGSVIQYWDWLEHASPVLYSANFSPDWKKLAWITRGTARIQDTVTGSEGPVINHEDFITDMDWSPSGTIITTSAAGEINGAYSPAVYFWNPTTGELLSTIASPSPVIDLSFSPDGSQFAYLNGDGKIIIYTIP